MKYILPILVVLTSCSSHEQETYEVFPNSIQAGGIAIDYDPESSLTNISKISSELGEKEADIFNKSLAWYGTESDFGFDKIHSKTARQLVNIVNCLKVTEPKSQVKCFQ